MISLLFMVALVGDNPADKPVLPPPPVVVTVAAPHPVQTAVALPPEGGKVTDGPVACNQPQGCGGGPVKPVTVIVATDQGDFPMSTGEADLAKIDANTATGVSKEENDARNLAELCEIKPWYCDDSYAR